MNKLKRTYKKNVLLPPLWSNPLIKILFDEEEELRDAFMFEEGVKPTARAQVCQNLSLNIFEKRHFWQQKSGILVSRYHGKLAKTGYFIIRVQNDKIQHFSILGIMKCSDRLCEE